MNKALSFFIGLLFGILICVLLFYYDVKFFETQCPKCDEKEIITLVKTDTVYVEIAPKPKKQYLENKISEDVEIENIEEKQLENEMIIYDSDFSFEGEEQDEVLSDKLLQTKTVKVKPLPQGKQEIKLPDDFFHFFEVQH